MKIIIAFEQGDPDQAAIVASAHIRTAGELLIAHFEANGRWSPTPPRPATPG